MAVEIKKALLLDREEYYETHLSIVNCILPSGVRMTPMEIKILGNFMALEGDAAEYRFSTLGRAEVMTKCRQSPSGLSNHLKSLIKKGLLKDNGVVTIFPLLFPEENEQYYRFRLVKIQAQNNGTAVTSEANMSDAHQ